MSPEYTSPKDLWDPKTRLFDGELLKHAKGEVKGDKDEIKPAADRLRADANRAFRKGPFSVTDKEELPPSGNPNDYLSQGPYWWPDPDKDDGLPYIRRDGERNPEVADLDRDSLYEMVEAVNTLALAYYFFEEERDAEHASHLLRVWFLDEETRMNPHLRYGQRIPGRSEGRGIGIVETRIFTRLVDAVTLLAKSESWSSSDHAALVEWFQSYLSWVVGSDNGRDEANWHNNHRTRYDKQVVAMALFADKPDLAAYSLALFPDRHLSQHIDPSGRQPHELDRTKALTYSASNLRDLFDLSRLGEHVGADYWAYETDDGASIKKALDWLVPYFTDEADFEYEQIDSFRNERAFELLRRGAIAFENFEYENAINRIPDFNPDAHRLNLIYPPSAIQDEPI